ncbi:MAG: hypothetical protein QM645_01495 [Asticcacaulis sp.]
MFIIDFWAKGGVMRQVFLALLAMGLWSGQALAVPETASTRSAPQSPVQSPAQSPVQAAMSDAERLSEAQINHAITSYYLYKDLDQIPQFLDYIQHSERVAESDGTIPPLAGFFGAVFKENPDKVAGWVKGWPFEGNARRVVIEALWLSRQTDHLKDYEPRVWETLQKSPDPSDVPVKSASDHDRLWGTFFATGDASRLKPIIDNLSPDKVLSGDALMDEAIRASAFWSLGVNMRVHDRVARLVRDEALVRTGAVQAELLELVKNQDEQRVGFPNEDGPFGAVMLIIPEKELIEFEKPADSGPHLTIVSTAVVGDVVAIKIVFSGMESDAESAVDVTFDLRVLAPDGKAYEGAEYQGLEGLKARLTSTSSGIFNNQAIILVRFEPQDARGEYIVEGVLHDNIGNRHIPLRATITLE